MRIPQVFTLIRNEHPGTLKRFRRRAPGAGGVFSALMQKKKAPRHL